MGVQYIWAKIGKKGVLFLMKTFFFLVFTWIWGKKVFHLYFFWSLLNFQTWTKSWSRFISPMLKIGQNWDKIANYPPQCSAKIGTTDIQCAARRRREGLGEFGVALYRLLNLIIKLRIAPLQKTQTYSGWQVVADLHFKNWTINEKLFGKTKRKLIVFCFCVVWNWTFLNFFSF